MNRSPTGNPMVMTLIAELHLSWKRYLQRALVGEDISLKQFHLLVRLEALVILRPAQVAEELYCDRPTASVILRNMEKRKWISRTQDPHNKKQVLIKLLAAGRRKLNRIRELPELKHRLRLDPCAGLTKQEVLSLNRLLQKLRGNLNECIEEE